MWYSIVITVLTAYLLGNLNGAVCMSAIVAHDDVRKHGSGNAGLTNFIRNYGAVNGLLVIVIDGIKTVLACLVGKLLLAPYGLDGAIIGGTAVMVGHIFPALLGFKGGKGILSGLFVALIADWRIALIILAVFLLVYLLTRYVSLGSIVAAAVFAGCFVGFYWGNWVVMVCGAFVGCLTIFMHRGNIARLIKGEERKTNLFGKGKQK